MRSFPADPSTRIGYSDGRVASVALPVVVGVSLILWMSGVPTAVTGAAMLFAEEPMIVSQTFLGTAACVDGSGAIKGDLDEWTTGSCDRIVCHVEPSGNYTITHSCRPREPSENPDVDNCAWVTNDTATYPDCCPVLSCGSSDPYTTIDPLTCFDLGTAYACGIWYNLTTGCTQSHEDVALYNISQVFCRQTCGLC